MSDLDTARRETQDFLLATMQLDLDYITQELIPSSDETIEEADRDEPSPEGVPNITGSRPVISGGYLYYYAGCSNRRYRINRRVIARTDVVGWCIPGRIRLYKWTLFV